MLLLWHVFRIDCTTLKSHNVSLGMGREAQLARRTSRAAWGFPLLFHFDYKGFNRVEIIARVHDAILVIEVVSL
jgi:hypothetical protein